MAQVFKSLYHIEVGNADGIQGFSYVNDADKTKIAVSSPMRQDIKGANPEQFIGLALATCLNATIEAEEGRRGLDHQSIVRVGVDLATDDPGYQFFIEAQVHIPHVDWSDAQDILAVAEKRCPVAKLLQGSPNVTIKLVHDFETANEELV